MKTAELVRRLQEADPGGELEVSIGWLEGGPERSMLVTTQSALVGRELRGTRVVLSPVEDAPMLAQPGRTT